MGGVSDGKCVTPKGESHSSKDARLRILEAQERERQRLAREIHDGPAQALANAIFELEYCEQLADREPDKLKRELARLKDDIRAGLVEVRRFIFDLRPAPGAEMGLVSVLRHNAENLQKRYGMTVALDVEPVEGLSRPQETAVYRIVQEALRNAQKHSSASKVTIRIKKQDDAILVAIEDDGVGFDYASASGDLTHYGLVSMQERAQLIGGELQIKSGPGKGTVVKLKVPCEPDIPGEMSNVLT